MVGTTASLRKAGRCSEGERENGKEREREREREWEREKREWEEDDLLDQQSVYVRIF